MDEYQNNQSSGKSILLADDEQFIAVAYKDGLERAGYNVTVAHDGTEVLEILKTFKPNLILMDLIMPKVNGFEVLKAIRQDKDLMSIPVVVLTNLSQSSDEEEARSYGIADFLVKADISLKDLLIRLGELLGPSTSIGT
jgi:two-component system alkaline phosphatase synthesis response regulator PhoP